MELAELEAEERLHPTLRARVHFLSARLARHEGRWADARRHFELGQRIGAEVGDEEDRERRTERAEDMAAAERARERDEAERQLRRLGWGRGRLARLGTLRLMGMLEIAARAGVAEASNAVLETLVERGLPPRLRLKVALEAMGAGDDAHVFALLDGLHERPGSLGLQAAYHRARALQRLGRLAEAELAFLEVIERDRGITPFYAMWAELQLDHVRADMVGFCGPEAACESPDPEAEGSAKPAGAPTPRMEGFAPPARAEQDEDVAEGEGQGEPEGPDFDALADRLGPIVEAHGEAYPWLGRAEDLLRLHRPEPAGRQLYEAFLAWREASGRPIRRAGIESVARGANRPRRFTSWQLRRDRKRISAEEREVLADIGAAIDDWGAATGWGGWDRVAVRPRAYEALVEEAAARHGLDPNLLFAVMRVESVYQKHIVSYAGAIGLCQIMPRTGQLIADAKGERDFTTADLLDPAVNLDFAAWYLRSLIERFDGHLPLAIASYNGGPHNVRRWLQDRPADMPLDVFLEHIPFGQTHRYVRRVLTHYRAYRAQEGLPMASLDDDLPTPRPDREIGF